jgi:hypothetical protein
MAFLKQLQSCPLGGRYLPTAATYKFYEIYTPYIEKPSVLVFTKATTDRQAPTRIFRIGADVMYKQVIWTAIRKGDWPKIPQVDESNGPLIHAEINPLSPVVTDTDAKTLVYKIEGRFVYVFNTPKPEGPSGDTLVAAKIPFLNIDQSRREISFQSDSMDLTSLSGNQAASQGASL